MSCSEVCNLFKLLLTAINDPLGGCCVTPYGYSVMLKKVGVEVNSLFCPSFVFALQGSPSLKIALLALAGCLSLS